MNALNLFKGDKIKIIVIVTIFILLTGLIGSCSKQGKTVKIGAQEWMTKNLNVSTFRNGDPIPEAKSDEEWEKAGNEKKPAWCYYDNDPSTDDRYGKLYNWYAVNDLRGLAPDGWHISSDAEWTKLTNFLGGEGIAGTKMKSKNGWRNEGNGTDESEFSGLPGGIRYLNGEFKDIGSRGIWWTSDKATISDYAIHRDLTYDDGNVNRDGHSNRFGYSVRCLRD